MNCRADVKAAFCLALVALCLFSYALHRQSSIAREFEATLLLLGWLPLVCIAAWCGIFLLMMFSLKDLPLVGLLLIALAAYFTSCTTSWPTTDALTLLFGVTLGKAAAFMLRDENRVKKNGCVNVSATVTCHSSAVTFLFGLIMLLMFALWWHLDMSSSFYHGPRWMGLWDNPNTYGMLVGVGVVLTTGLLATNLEFKMQNLKLGSLLGIVAGMMSLGLVMSYSRGAWLGTSIALLYLAWNYGRLKWKFVVSFFIAVAAMVFLFWSATQDSEPWYVKRADLGRPSAQHRVSAWRAGLEIMWAHPFGVGWNNAVSVYNKNYSPPEGGAAAITTNDYLMIGVELGIPALLCFVAYAGLCYRNSPRPHLAIPTPSSASNNPSLFRESEALRAACLSGALVLLVAFWFDGGLFKLPTAALFWVLLELGAYRVPKVESGKLGGWEFENGLIH